MLVRKTYHGLLNEQGVLIERSSGAVWSVETSGSLRDGLSSALGVEIAVSSGERNGRSISGPAIAHINIVDINSTIRRSTAKSGSERVGEIDSDNGDGRGSRSRNNSRNSTTLSDGVGLCRRESVYNDNNGVISSNSILISKK